MTGSRQIEKRYDGIANRIITQCDVSKAMAKGSLLNGEKHPLAVPFRALWDTGATMTLVTKTVVERLGLKARAKASVYTPSGLIDVDVFYVNILLYDTAEITELPVTCGILDDEIDLLIGMDVISKGSFSVVNENGQTVFTFKL